MNHTPARSELVAGPAPAVAALISNYSCGHCNSDTTTRTDGRGLLHLVIHHDDGCPVLTGTLSALPDTFRAAAAPHHPTPTA